MFFLQHAQQFTNSANIRFTKYRKQQSLFSCNYPRESKVAKQRNASRICALNDFCCPFMDSANNNRKNCTRSLFSFASLLTFAALKQQQCNNCKNKTLNKLRYLNQTDRMTRWLPIAVCRSAPPPIVGRVPTELSTNRNFLLASMNALHSTKLSAS